MKLTKAELLKKLHKINEKQQARPSGRQGVVEDEEHDHIKADEALLDFIDDEEIRAAYEALTRWYS